MQKKVVLFTLALLLVTALGIAIAKQGMALADKEAAQQDHVGPLLEKLAKALDLTPVQKSALNSILSERNNKLKELKQDKSLTPEQKKAKAKEIIEQSDFRIKTLLTPKQCERFDQIREKIKKRFSSLADRKTNERGKLAERLRGRKFLRDAPGKSAVKARRVGSKIADALKLTEEQREKIKPLLKERRERVRTILQDQSLSAEQKKAEIRKLRDETRSKIEQILTDEQREKLEKMKSKLRHKLKERRAKEPA